MASNYVVCGNVFNRLVFLTCKCILTITAISFFHAAASLATLLSSLEHSLVQYLQLSSLTALCL